MFTILVYYSNHYKTLEQIFTKKTLVKKLNNSSVSTGNFA